MARVLYIAALLLIADQASKALAAVSLPGQRILLAPSWGLTYTVNHGIWVSPSLDPGYLPWLATAALLLMAGGAVHVAFYRRYYRRSIWVDLSYAALLAGLLGNLVLDRLLAGGARDFLITPIAVCNFSDIYGSVCVWAAVVELVQFPRARRLLRWSPPTQWVREARLLWRFFRVRILKRRKRGMAALLLAVLVVGCSQASAPAPATPPVAPAPAQAQTPAPAPPPPRPVPEPVVLFDGTAIRLPEGMSGRLPAGVSVSGFRTLVLEGLTEETANITFSDCPTGAPNSGCIGNHRGTKTRSTVTVASQTVSRFEADFQKPSAAGDSRTWLELHTIVPLPSGRRVDIVGQVLTGSGQEERLRTTYEALLRTLAVTDVSVRIRTPETEKPFAD
ncbi:MAG TPA: signal peptidase II [Symbiobacteriaceae bacterium]|nr:signal peptidase II [Symbiobacteriaceae bacterium]